jgi:hypothetical protein
MSVKCILKYQLFKKRLLITITITDDGDKTLTRSSVANTVQDLRCLAFVTSRLTGK